VDSPTWTKVAAALSMRPPGRVAEPITRRAAVALVLRDSGRGLELLFIRRADDPRDPWSGHTAFPGGRSEPGDPDLAGTAIRETQEELGLDLSQAALPLGVLDEVQAVSRMRRLDLAISPFVFRLLEDVDLRPSAEVRSVHWLRFEDLVADRHRSSMDHEHEGDVFELPCLRVGGLVIWGLTYRMFTDLRERLAAGGVGALAEGNPA
jgi:8-oxo-dGTP pyrophosphatase MutT (NUDIX family)